jgi:hypothetical protein
MNSKGKNQGDSDCRRIFIQWTGTEVEDYWVGRRGAQTGYNLRCKVLMCANKWHWPDLCWLHNKLRACCCLWQNHHFLLDWGWGWGWFLSQRGAEKPVAHNWDTRLEWHCVWLHCELHQLMSWVARWNWCQHWGHDQSWRDHTPQWQIKVWQHDVSICTHKHILRLQISVHNSHHV